MSWGIEMNGEQALDMNHSMSWFGRHQDLDRRGFLATTYAHSYQAKGEIEDRLLTIIDGQKCEGK